MPPVAPVAVFRIALEVLVEEALAAQIMVDADDVRRAGVFLEPGQLGLLGTRPAEVLPEWMITSQAAAEQVEASPATSILQLRLVRQQWGTPRFTQVVGLDEPRGGIDHTDRTHGEDHGAALDQECPD